MTRLSVRARILGLAGWLALAYAAAAVGAIASVQASAFYAQLERPPWAPPGWVFGPVWSLLYALMGIAAWLVWQAPMARSKAAPLTLFVVQLGVNALWSWLFFVWRLGALAFADAMLLLGLIAATLVAFWRFSSLAAILLVPYLAWVAFACALTWSVWRVNPGALG